jgi:SSS family solute:Na+ symporter
MVNPFDASKVADFNLWYVVMQLAVYLYSTMAWQNAHAMNSSAITAHESRMANVLSKWRGFAGGAMGTLLSMSLLVYLTHPPPAFVDHMQKILSTMPLDHEEMREQARISVGMSYMLPVGIKGIVCAIFLMGLFALDEMHLHSWSSILVQDVVLPLRQRPLTTRQHLWALRLGIILVAAFAFVFGASYNQTQNIALWFGVTQAIYTGGAGAVIIGGLYWSRGTTMAAWVAMIVGSTLAVGGILLQQPFWSHLGFPAWVGTFWTNALGQLEQHLGPKTYLANGSSRGFPLNGMEVSFYGSIIAMTLYVAVSLLSCRTPHDMDRLLHRGKFAVEPEGGETAVKPITRFNVAKIIGIDEQFTRGDRWAAGGIFGWNMLWVALAVVGSVLYCIHPWSNGAWVDFWLASAIWVNFVIGAITCVWFTVGGVRDMGDFFRRLRREKIDVRDDGTVYRDEKPAEPREEAQRFEKKPTVIAGG